ncbi:MAG TPA: hypothetical protein VJU82_07685 [Acidobacteriaceae bacterium]|nr:hypothetical protein [Acidobacteriaceae bacterium]
MILLPQGAAARLLLHEEKRLYGKLTQVELAGVEKRDNTRLCTREQQGG